MVIAWYKMCVFTLIFKNSYISWTVGYNQIEETRGKGKINLLVNVLLKKVRFQRTFTFSDREEQIKSLKFSKYF